MKDHKNKRFLRKCKGLTWEIFFDKYKVLELKSRRISVTTNKKLQRNSNIKKKKGHQNK